MDCTVCGVAKSRTRLSDFHFTFTRGQSLTVIDALLLLIRMMISSINGFPGGSVSKESACNVGDLGSIPGLGRAPGKGNGYPLQVFLGFPCGSAGKESIFSAGDLGWKDPLEKGKATHSSTLA